MDDKPINVIRETTRNLLSLNRKTHRNQACDLRREVDELLIKPNTVVAIINKLKTKTAVSAGELNILKNALIDDMKNIEILLSTHGALRGLVREISGCDAKKQLAAAGCFCNLATGDLKACITVAKHAGPYLVTALDNLSVELAVTCAWSLGNLAGSGMECCDLLAAQGSLAKLIDLLVNTNEDVRDATLYALIHFAYQMNNEMKDGYLKKVILLLPTLPLSISSAQLIFIISCHKHFDTPDLELYEKIVPLLPSCIDNHVSTCQNNDCCELIYLVRFLANSIKENVYSVVLNIFLVKVGSLKLLLNKGDRLSESLLWLLGNMFKYYSHHDFFKELLNCKS